MFVYFLYTGAVHLRFYLFANWIYGVIFKSEKMQSVRLIEKSNYYEDKVRKDPRLAAIFLMLMEYLAHGKIGISWNYYCVFDGRYRKKTKKSKQVRWH